MNAAAREDVVRVASSAARNGCTSATPDVAIVRGTSADPDGNISMEHEGHRSARSRSRSRRATAAAW